MKEAGIRKRRSELARFRPMPPSKGHSCPGLTLSDSQFGDSTEASRAPASCRWRRSLKSSNQNVSESLRSPSATRQSRGIPTRDSRLCVSASRRICLYRAIVHVNKELKAWRGRPSWTLALNYVQTILSTVIFDRAHLCPFGRMILLG